MFKLIGTYYVCMIYKKLYIRCHVNYLKFVTEFMRTQLRISSMTDVYNWMSDTENQIGLQRKWLKGQIDINDKPESNGDLEHVYSYMFYMVDSLQISIMFNNLKLDIVFVPYIPIMTVTWTRMFTKDIWVIVY